MTCADVERVLPELLAGAPDSAFQSAFEIHLKSCPDCSDLVSDLNLISSEARKLVESDEPGPQVWLRIAAQLRAEGLIREPAARPVLIPARRGLWREWWLVPVAAMLLVAGSYIWSHKAPPQVAKHQIPDTPVQAQVPLTAPPSPQTIADQSSPVQSPPQVASNPKRPPRAVEPDAEDQQFLSVVSTRAPSMRATYEGQLQAVDAQIREVQAYLDQNPEDADARQHLMDVYQEKALLYQIALDRIQ
jgi:Putative zinc-finger